MRRSDDAVDSEGTSTKKRRRGHGEGGIYQRESDGRWVGAVDLGFSGAKRKRKVVYGKTRKEVGDKIKLLLHDQQQGLPITTERQTVARFLTRWLDESAKSSVRPKTYRFYEQIVRLYLVPEIGRKQLSKLSAQDVQGMLNHHLAAGLSPRTVNHCRAVLRKALNDAARWNLVSRNVASLTRPPKTERPTRRYLTPTEARTFLDTVAGHRLEALFTVALALGLRQGEALGLRWEDIDLDVGKVSVKKALQRVDGKLTLVEPKSDSSRRTLHLPEVVLRTMKEHRRRQLEERLAAGVYWEEHGLVFTTCLGTPLDARNVVRQFYKLRQAADLPWLRFHDLRHGFGSLLAAQGVHPRTAMELMGHSQISLTMEIYSHVAPELAREAAAKIDVALGS